MKLRRAEAENHLENRRQENKPNSEANALLEGLGKFYSYDDIEEEVRNGDNIKNREERFHVKDFKGRIFGVNRD